MWMLSLSSLNSDILFKAVQDMKEKKAQASCCIHWINTASTSAAVVTVENWWAESLTDQHRLEVEPIFLSKMWGEMESCMSPAEHAQGVAQEAGNHQGVMVFYQPKKERRKVSSGQHSQSTQIIVLACRTGLCTQARFLDLIFRWVIQLNSSGLLTCGVFV